MRTRDEFIEYVAPIVHEALSAWSVGNGQPAYPSWKDADRWMQDATYKSICFLMDNPSASDSALHDQWREQKLKDGWTLGLRKDPIAKTHPQLVEFEDLPEFEKKKDTLLKALVLELLRQDKDF